MLPRARVLVRSCQIRSDRHVEHFLEPAVGFHCRRARGSGTRTILVTLMRTPYPRRLTRGGVNWERYCYLISIYISRVTVKGIDHVSCIMYMGGVKSTRRGQHAFCANIAMYHILLDPRRHWVAHALCSAKRKQFPLMCREGSRNDLHCL